MEGRIVRTYDVNDTLQLRYVEVAPEVIVRGVYARVDIPNQTMVEECAVIPIYANENTARINLYRSYAYNWRMRDESGNLVVKDAIATGMASLYNHDDPGNLTNVEYKKEFRMEFWSISDIAAGDELTHDYMWGRYAGTRLNPVDKYLRPITGRSQRSH